MSDFGSEHQGSIPCGASIKKGNNHLRGSSLFVFRTKECNVVVVL
jgi:hypothetical protein